MYAYQFPSSQIMQYTYNSCERGNNSKILTKQGDNSKFTTIYLYKSWSCSNSSIFHCVESLSTLTSTKLFVIKCWYFRRTLWSL